jgi:hypothetical protein
MSWAAAGPAAAVARRRSERTVFMSELPNEVAENSSQKRRLY